MGMCPNETALEGALIDGRVTTLAMNIFTYFIAQPTVWTAVIPASYLRVWPPDPFQPHSCYISISKLP